MRERESEIDDAEFFDLPQHIGPEKKKPLSGWRRLWIVLSVLMGAPSFLIAWGENDQVVVYVTADSAIRSSKGQDFWNQLWAQARQEYSSEFSSCVWRSARMDHAWDWTYRIECRAMLENG